MPPSNQSADQPPQQPEAPSFSPPNAAPAPAGGEDPGKTMGIIGFVLAFFVPIVGLILSIIGFKKSKTAGYKNGLALAGIILNIVFIVLSIIVGILFFMLTATAIQEAAREKQSGSENFSIIADDEAMTSSGKALATEIIDVIDEGIAAGEPAYPATLSELSPPDDITQSKTKIVTAPIDGNTIEFYACDKGNKVGYWDFLADKIVYIYTTGTTESSNCTLATS